MSTTAKFESDTLFLLSGDRVACSYSFPVADGFVGAKVLVESTEDAVRLLRLDADKADLAEARDWNPNAELVSVQY